MSRREAEADAVALYREMRLPDPEEIGFRYPHQAVSYTHLTLPTIYTV